MSGVQTDRTARTVGAWNRFWFTPAATLPFALFRIFFAWALWIEIPTGLRKNVEAMGKGIQLPYEGLAWLPRIGPDAYQFLHAIQYPLILLFGLGILARPAAAGLGAIYAYFLLVDQLAFRNHPYFFVLLLGAAALGPISDALAGDPLLRAGWKGKGWRWSRLLGSQRPPTAQRLIQVTICIAYLYAAFHKFNPEFLSGRVLGHYLPRDLAYTVGGDLIRLLPGLELARVQDALRVPAVLQGLSWASIAMELTLPVALWVPPLRRWAIAAGIAFHAAIGAGMGIYSFSIAWAGALLLFLDPVPPATDRPPSRHRPLPVVLGAAWLLAVVTATYAASAPDLPPSRTESVDPAAGSLPTAETDGVPNGASAGTPEPSPATRTPGAGPPPETAMAAATAFAPALPATATAYCSSCHLLPPAAALPRDAWAQFLDRKPRLLDRFRRVRGEASDAGAGHPLGTTTWTAIREAYLAAAPATPAIPRRRTARPMQESSLRYRVLQATSAIEGADLSMVRVLPNGRVVTGTADGHAVHIGPFDGTPTGTVPVGGAPTDLTAAAGAPSAATGPWAVSVLGPAMVPSTRPAGALLHLHESGTTETVAGGLRRPAAVSRSDLDGDGRFEYVVAEFGFWTGGVSVRDPAARDGATEWWSRDAGAVEALPADLTGDGLTDLVVLTAQQHETVVLHERLPGNPVRFRRRVVARRHPGFGLNAMIVADMDGDGRRDLVVTNGDNGDLESRPLRPYHGVRILYQTPAGEFEPEFVYPMHGASGVRAADFNGDGRRDLVAIAFYPDFGAPWQETLVYLEQQADGSFQPYHAAAAGDGRWLSLDVGDPDGDGDPDVLLAAGTAIMSGPWQDARPEQARFPRLAILENVGKARRDDGGS